MNEVQISIRPPRVFARELGLPTDDAGHMVGNQLGGSGGKAIIFPQNPNINRGQFAQFEARVANMVKQKGDVKITITFDYANEGTRPTTVHYEAVASNGTELKQSFDNPCH